MGKKVVRTIVGYHGTKSKFKDSIIEHNFECKEKKDNDDYWLGHGIYFYEDYDLAEWWAQKKVSNHNHKFGESNLPVVIKAKIIANNILDLDKRKDLNLFCKNCEKILAGFKESGIVFDLSRHTIKMKRCFYIDLVKENSNIDVFMYTFKKEKPSYADGQNVIITLDSIGMQFNERQICVSKPDIIFERRCVTGADFDEVIV